MNRCRDPHHRRGESLPLGGKIHERHYWTVTAFTTTDELPPLYELVERSHSDDLPGITYTEIDASEEYLDWTGEQTAEPA